MMFAFSNFVLAESGTLICGGLITLFTGILCLAVTWWIIKYFYSEFERGQRPPGPTLDEMAESMPRKPAVIFKGEKVPEWQIAERDQATKAILKFLAYGDNWFERKYLMEVASESFRMVKDALADRTVKGIERRLTEDCLEDVRRQIKKLRKDREVRVFDKVLVPTVQVLHVEAPVGRENHTFTALITGKSRDYHIDEESGDITRGDEAVYLYQEFWTFRRTEKRWLVELIRPSSDVDAVMEAKNVLAPIDLEEFSKEADPVHLKHVVAR